MSYKQKEAPTQQFIQMSQPQRQSYVQSIPLSQFQFPNLSQGHKYPEQNFMELKGQEQGKIINLQTYRYPTTHKQAKGILIILHSVYAHSQYTAHIAKKLSEEGYTTVAYDMRGAGKSEGQRGQWNDYKAILKQAYDFIKGVQKLYPCLPLFVLGWGIPALNILHISLYHYSEFNFAGIIMACTLFRSPSTGKNFEVVGSVAQGTLNIAPAKIGIYKPNFSFFTKYKNIADILENDPLNAHEMTTANTVMEFNDLLLDIPQRLWEKIDTPPIVVLHGMADKYGSGYYAYDFYNKIKSQDKQLWYYKDMNFAFMLEDQYPQIQARLIKWLKVKTEKFLANSQKANKQQQKPNEPQSDEEESD